MESANKDPKEREPHPKSAISQPVRVTLRLTDADWHGHALETLWAEALGEDKYRIKNVPFYAYDLSYDDIVEAKSVNGEVMVEKVVARSGHSTYRIFVCNDAALAQFDDFWKPLAELGCTFERATERLFAIDVPSQADIYSAYAAFERGADASVWDFEEAHLGHPLRDATAD